MSSQLDLEQQVERAEAMMLNDPEHTLRPFYREAIYQTIDVLSAEKAGAVRGWLAVLAAELVLPVWRQQWPDDALPEHMIQMSRALLLGEVEPEIAIVKAEQGWGRLTELERRPEAAGHSRPVFACEAAVEALFEALGSRPFNFLNISESTRNNDMEPDSTDAAFYASLAFAGPEVWAPFAADEKGPPPSPEKRKEFWQWWLREAIPTAWGLAMK